MGYGVMGDGVMGDGRRQEVGGREKLEERCKEQGQLAEASEEDLGLKRSCCANDDDDDVFKIDCVTQDDLAFVETCCSVHQNII